MKSQKKEYFPDDGWGGLKYTAQTSTKHRSFLNSNKDKVANIGLYDKEIMEQLIS